MCPNSWYDKHLNVDHVTQKNFKKKFSFKIASYTFFKKLFYLFLKIFLENILFGIQYLTHQTSSDASQNK